MNPMPPGRPLTWYERLFLAIARPLSEVSTGYSVSFDEEIVRQHGLKGLMRFGRATSEAFNAMQKTFGVETSNLLAGFSSFFNGCEYCAWGHIYALALLYFERTGKLYPIDETETRELMMRPDTEVLAELKQRLEAVEPEHARLLLRQYELRKMEGPITGDEDRLLVRSIALYEWVNECSIVSEAPAPPMNPIAKKKDLMAKYNEARGPERAARAARAQAAAAAATNAAPAS